MCIKCNENYTVNNATRLNPMPARYSSDRIFFEGEQEVRTSRRQRYSPSN